MRILLLLLMLAKPVSAHELWIQPLNWQPSSDGSLEADLVNGELFEGVKLAYLPSWFSRFEIVAGEVSAPVDGRLGDMPALGQPVLVDGLNVIVYQSVVSKATYEKLEEFLEFTKHKDLGDIEKQHRDRGLPDVGFSELFRRYSKALIGAGTGAGADNRVGLETEIVALDNPYAAPLSTVRVQVFYADAVRADAQVELFEKAADGSVIVTLHRTNASGVAFLPVRSGYEYMVDAVVLRVPSDAMAADFDAAWETLWANLTFFVP